jgi:hypothetical protein
MIPKKSQLNKKSADTAEASESRVAGGIDSPAQSPQEESRAVATATNHETRDVVRFSVDIDREVHIALKCYAAKNSLTIVSALTHLINTHCT